MVNHNHKTTGGKEPAIYYDESYFPWILSAEPKSGCCPDGKLVIIILNLGEITNLD